MSQILSFLQQNINLLIRNLCASLVAFFEIAAFQILVEDLALEYLNNLELSTSLHLEALELADLVLEIVNYVAFLE